MKKLAHAIWGIVLATGMFAVTGCESVPVTKTPERQIDVFRDGQTPERQTVVVKVLKDDGRLDEQEDIEARMTKEAKKLGADAIIFNKLVPSGQEGGILFGHGLGFGNSKITYFYKATAVKYQ